LYTVSVYAKGPNKASAIITVSKKNYKLDIFHAEPDELPAAILYATGSKEFNVKMRALAKRRGFLLNQRGLFSLNTSGKSGKRVPLKTERDYFSALGLTYVSPDMR
jgi:DNA polymerase (family 10)